MEDHHGAGRARELLLTGDVLVPVESGAAHSSEVAAGHESCTAFAWCHVVGVPEQLHVEGGVRRIGDRIDVQRLGVGRVRLEVVGEVVIERRVRTDERFDDPSDLRKAQVLADR